MPTFELIYPTAHLVRFFPGYFMGRPPRHRHLNRLRRRAASTHAEADAKTDAGTYAAAKM